MPFLIAAGATTLIAIFFAWSYFGKMLEIQNKESDAAPGQEVPATADEAPGVELLTRSQLIAMETREAALYLWRRAVRVIAARGDVEDNEAGDLDTAAAMVTAHALLETGDLDHFVDHNLWGVNAKGSEPYIIADDNKNPRKFRDYPTFDDAIEAYCDLVSRVYVDAWAVATEGDCEAYARGLKNPDGEYHYFEANLEQFTANLQRKYDTILTWYAESDWQR